MRWLLAPMVALLTSVACHSLSSLESCQVDADCPRGTGCNVEKRFCETGKPVRIGVIVSLSGNLRLSAIGKTAKEALELGKDLLDAMDVQVLDRGIELVFADDESDVAQAAARAKALVDANVVAVIGPLTSSQALAARERTTPAGVVQIAPLAGGSELADPEPALERRFHFQLTPRISNGSPLALVKYLGEEQARSVTAPRCMRSFVLFSDDAAGRDYDATFRDRLGANGMCVRASRAVPLTRKSSYEEEVRQLFAAKPDCVILSVLPDVAGSFLEEVDRQGTIDWAWFGTTLVHSPQFLEAARVSGSGDRSSRSEGFVGADLDFSPNRNAYRELLLAVNRLREARGDAPLAELPPFSTHYVDALFVIALALERAGGASGAALRDALIEVANADPDDEAFSPGQIPDAIRALRRGRQIDYVGASSDIELVSGGFMLASPTAIWRVEDGAFVEKVRTYGDRDLADVRDAEGDACR